LLPSIEPEGAMDELKPSLHGPYTDSHRRILFDEDLEVPCASCRSRRRVRLHPDLQVPICARCFERACPPDIDDELGVVD
jgi:hypothetical protein